MVDALFLTFDGGGNLPPALDIAGEIVRRGGTARFLGHATQRERIERAGFGFASYPTGRQYDFAAQVSMPVDALRIRSMLADRRIGQDAIVEADRGPTDVVIVDCLLIGAISTVLDAGLPAVSLFHTTWTFVSSARKGLLAAAIGLFGGKVADAFDRPELVLVTTRLDFEEATVFPPSVVHTGVVLSGAPRSAASSAGSPRVLVSLSTGTTPGQARSLQAILDALEPLDADVIVTTGPAIDPAKLRPPVNAEVHRYADHTAILPTVSLLVGHGGHSTTVRALSHDVPVLVLPQDPLSDQAAIGAAVERLGVGRTLPRKAKPAEIRSAAVELLADGPHRDAVARLGAELREHDGAGIAADLIEEFVAEHAPANVA